MEQGYIDACNTLEAVANYDADIYVGLEMIPLYPSDLHSEVMLDIRLHPKYYTRVLRTSSVCVKFELAEFPRSEIKRWLDAIGMKSVYQFDREQANVTLPIQTPVGKWPWGTYHTELLGHLEAAALEFWVNYDPLNAKSTAPKNETVIAWLEARKVSNQMAKTIATMLRPSDLPTGPRK